MPLGRSLADVVADLALDYGSAAPTPVLFLVLNPQTFAGMLERSSSSRKNLHVVWNEENLKENEEIQKEYSAVRIQEPKTPYRPPLPSDSLEDEMKPLQLDEGREPAAAAAAFGGQVLAP